MAREGGVAGEVRGEPVVFRSHRVQQQVGAIRSTIGGDHGESDALGLPREGDDRRILRHLEHL